MNTSILRNSLLAAACAMTLASPALADPPWRHDGPPGWSKHHHGWSDHRGWRDRDGWSGYRYYGPPPVVYGRPRVIYVPPPVVYVPQRPGITINLPLDLQ
ncbi:conserved exported protein of unknown function (without similar domain) [Magnetospirillum sp. XM-1]|uniref:hypothetical protein n=1 Tax=Magnetospirillum sp. XM-1 TaxID=1663591 RepID=UPI00073E0646|nr:hypothetical protein [Magnetospirillum sp. XM-1]CUW41063.1 conserved exported protein of unknown function (without similar domain) [Magnetospirillum sp. XM-1]